MIKVKTKHYSYHSGKVYVYNKEKGKNEYSPELSNKKIEGTAKWVDVEVTITLPIYLPDGDSRTEVSKKELDMLFKNNIEQLANSGDCNELIININDYKPKLD